MVIAIYRRHSSQCDCKAMAELTEWEKQHLDSIHLLLEEANDVIEYFKQSEETLSKKSQPERNVDEEMLKFRLIVFNLSSVLDYTYYFLFCHFLNKGQANLSHKSTQCGFPFSFKGVKISETSSHDTSKKFVNEKLRFLWGDCIGEGTHIWKEVGDVILAIQPKLKVDSSGSVTSPHPVISSCDQESHALLHYYRNCCTHRGLVYFEAKDMIFQIDLNTRAMTIVGEPNHQEGIFNFHVPKTAYWIQLPEHIQREGYTKNFMPRMLMELLQQLFTFVRRVSSQLLFSALLLPRPEVILRSYLIDGFALDVVVEMVSKSHVATVKILNTDGEECYIESITCTDKHEAIHYSCTSLLETLAAKNAYYIRRPYKHMYATRHSYAIFPPVQILQTSLTKTYRMLLNNELQQKVKNLNLVFDCSNEGPNRVGEQCFEFRSCVSISLNEQNLLSVKSTLHRQRSKDKAQEEAAKEVIEVFVRWGFIQLN